MAGYLLRQARLIGHEHLPSICQGSPHQKKNDPTKKKNDPYTDSPAMVDFALGKTRINQRRKPRLPSGDLNIALAAMEHHRVIAKSSASMVL